MSAELTLLSLPGPPEGRLGETLSAALAGRAVQPYETGMDLAGRRLLFAAALPEWGISPEFSRLLAFLRTHPSCLKDSVGGVIVDSPGELYTKSAGRDLALAANLAGCAFPGRPLVEGTGDLRNLAVQAKNAALAGEMDEGLALALARAALDVLAGRRDITKYREDISALIAFLDTADESKFYQASMFLWGVRAKWMN